MRKRVGAVVGGVIVAIISELPLAAIAPPAGLIVRGAPAPWRLVDLVRGLKLCSVEAHDLTREKPLESGSYLNLPERAAAAE